MLSKILKPEAEHSEVLQHIKASALKHSDVTLTHSKQVQTQQPSLHRFSIQPVNLDHPVTPLHTSGTQLTQNLKQSPSHPPEPSMMAVDKYMVPPEMTNLIPLGQDGAQSPLLPSGTVPKMYMAAIMSAKATTEVEHSMEWQEVTDSSLKHPEVTHTSMAGGSSAIKPDSCHHSGF